MSTMVVVDKRGKKRVVYKAYFDGYKNWLVHPDTANLGLAPLLFSNYAPSGLWKTGVFPHARGIINGVGG